MWILQRVSHSLVIEDSVDGAFLIAGQLCSSNRSPYEDSSQEEEHSPLLTALTIPVCSVCGAFLTVKLADIRIFTYRFATVSNS